MGATIPPPAKAGSCQVINTYYVFLWLCFIFLLFLVFWYVLRSTTQKFHWVVFAVVFMLITKLALSDLQGGCPCGPPPTSASAPEPEPPASESEESEIGLFILAVSIITCPQVGYICAKSCLVVANLGLPTELNFLDENYKTPLQNFMGLNKSLVWMFTTLSLSQKLTMREWSSQTLLSHMTWRDLKTLR